MEEAVLLAVVASFFTGTSSVCQRLGAKDHGDATGLDLRLVFRLARQPIWLLGLCSMILGFGFQLSALHFGDLALVQPILATELLFVFAYMTIIGSRRVKRRDWMAAGAMAVGLGLFLLTAAPSGGRLHAPGFTWLLAGLVSAGVVALLLAVAFGWGRHSSSRRSRRAAVLGIATGVSWGFVAAVIKELSSHLDGGLGAIVSNWSFYVLIGAGAASMLLASHALSAGPLAASQPGFTIVDPLSASLLGLFLFGEHIQVGTLDLAMEALALAVLLGGVSVLSHSQLVVGDDTLPDGPDSADRSDDAARSDGAARSDDATRSDHADGSDDAAGGGGQGRDRPPPAPEPPSGPTASAGRRGADRSSVAADLPGCDR